MSYLQKLFPSTAGISAMPPRTTSDPTSKKRALPFKAPSRIGNGGASTTTTKVKASAKAKASAPAKGKGGFKTARAIVLSDDEEEDNEDDEEGEVVVRPAKGKGKARAEKDSDIEMISDDEVSEEEEPVPAPVRKPAPKRTLDAPMTIPPKLLTRLLYEGFEDKDMKIGKEAMGVVGKYMETFVREAIARAVFERNGDEEGDELGDGFLQVEDLEKLAPQLLLDF